MLAKGRFSVVLLGLTLLCASTVRGDDWSRFRGNDGAGISEKGAPIKWSEESIRWKIQLPGPGSSSPIVVGDKIFLTCWTGYGVDRSNPGNQEDLKRHLLCIDRNTGKIIWDKTVKAVLPEDRYGGMFAENGYATHTPVSDGEKVFAFFGKSGVYAYDMEGQELWNAKVGSSLDPRNWGSASSPILYKDKLIVTASAEDQALVALDKNTGKQVWKAPAESLTATWSTPVIMKTPDGRDDLVIGVPYEIWGLNPETGKLRWFCESIDSNSMCTSVVKGKDSIVYAVGGRNGGSIAVKVDGKGDVSNSNVIWKGSDRARIGTPIIYDDRIYWIYNGIANCISATDGKKIYQERLKKPALASEESSSPAGGRRGRGGGGEYSSPVVAGDHMYFVTRKGVAYVIKLGKEFEQVAANVLSDGGDFSASPAVSDGQIFIRSSKHLYCIGEK